MRIVAGQHRGRSLIAPHGAATRPTADRTRQALFNVLEHAAFAPPLRGARLIDLFAGTGALGLEALSRGAQRCVFVENAPAACAAIEANLTALRLTDRGRLLRADATRLPRAPSAAGGADGASLAFLDPPYGAGLTRPALEGLKAGGWLDAGALAVVETGADEAAPAADGYEPIDDRRWGAARVWFLRLI